MAQVTAFGKQVKKRLVDIDKNQSWLIDEVRKRTGLFVDSGYLWRILTGARHAPRVTEAICEILNIELPQTDVRYADGQTIVH